MDSQIEIDISEFLKRNSLDFLRNKSILVTGGSGLVGSYIVQAIQSLILKRIGPSRLVVTSKSGKFPISLLDSTEIIRGDLIENLSKNSLEKFDVVIHSAGYGQPEKFMANPMLTLSLNTLATEQLLQLVNQDGYFLFISSSEVYSGLTTPPFKEVESGSTNTNHPRAPYIEAKRTGEAMVAVARKYLGVNAKSVRLALAYGPGTKLGDTRVLNTFIEQALNHKKILLKDSGVAWRTYCYVLDAVQMIFDVLEKGNDDIYNIGGKSRIQISGLAEIIASLTGSELLIPTDNNFFQEGSPSDVWLDLEKTGGLSDLSNLIPIEEGLKRTISWRSNTWI